jgi:acid phosphatase family membrane protein YuiD
MVAHPPFGIFSNIWIGCAFASWGMAQFCKLISAFLQTREWDFAYFTSTGGMPSAHTATVCGLATSVGITNGFGSVEFALAFALAGITMFDASTVRQAAGKQASLLNQIVREFLQNHRLAEKPLKELLGHTRFEVFMGMLVGMATAANMTLRYCNRN